MFDYAAASGLNLPPDAAKELNRIMYEDPREVMYQLEREALKEANRQFEQLRTQIQDQEKERQRLWGKKYPRVLGQKPPETVKASTDASKGPKTLPRAGKVARN